MDEIHRTNLFVTCAGFWKTSSYVQITYASKIMLQLSPLFFKEQVEKTLVGDDPWILLIRRVQRLPKLNNPPLFLANQADKKEKPPDAWLG